MALHSGFFEYGTGISLVTQGKHVRIFKRIAAPSRDGQAGSAEMLQLDCQVPWPPCQGPDFLELLADVPWPVGSAPWSSMLGAVRGEESPGTASEQDGEELG
jgi:hypothetical protein